MRPISLLRKGLAYHERKGPLRTFGAVVRYSGEAVERYCEWLYGINEADREKGYPLSVRLRAARHGFSAYSYLWLGLDEPSTDVDRYLSTNRRFAKVNHGYIAPIHNKHAFQVLTEPHVDSFPALYGRIDDGEFTATKTTEVERVPDLVERTDEVVLKPVEGAKGDGIQVVERTDDAFAVNGRRTDREELDALLDGLDGYLVTEFVSQHAYAAAIYPLATNTIRLYSIVDPETGVASVLQATHRFGSADSEPTDNWSRGGYCAPIDVETGRIKRLNVLDDPPRRKLERHPGTDAQVAGVTVPYWDEVCDLVRDVADLHYQAPLVGWDVLVTETGPVLIEGNARPNKDLVQVERGLFEDPRARRLLGRR